tara:strand:- start:297 stop:725 length:429 start_codon:yes stop_codon:yes gene_type:complete
MSKSKDQKTKPLLQKLTEGMNKYEGTNYIYDGSDNTINTEAEMKKKFTAQDNYKLLKSVANNQEKKEFRDIERKYKKKSSIAQRTVPSEEFSVGKVPLNLFDYNFQKNFYKPDDTLKRIEKDRNKLDPDFYKGLGTFFQKKF